MTPARCLACGAEAAPTVPGQIQAIHHQPTCQAEHDRYVETALAALAEYRAAKWAYQDTGETLDGAVIALDAAEFLADRVAALAGYAWRLAQPGTPVRAASITRTAMDQGESIRQVNDQLRARVTELSEGSTS